MFQPRAPEEASLTPSTANGDIFILLGVHHGMVVTCDFATRIFTARADEYTWTPGLMAFCNLPPGPHFVWVCVPKIPWQQGYWFFTSEQRPGRTIVKRWNPDWATLQDGTVVDEHVYAVHSPPVKAFDYRDKQAELGSWQELTSYISERLLQRLTHANPEDRCWLVAHLDSGNTAYGTKLLPWVPPPQVLGPVAFDFHFRSFDLYIGQRNKLYFDRSIHARLLVANRFPQPLSPLSSSDLGPAAEWVVEVLENAKSERLRAILRTRAAAMADTTGDAVLDTALAELEAADAATDVWDEMDLVGEMQFAFLLATRLKSAACLRQWHNAVCGVFLQAPDLAFVRPHLLRFALDAVRSQMVFLRLEAKDQIIASATASGLTGSTRLNYYDLSLYSSLCQFKFRLDTIIEGLCGRATTGQRELFRSWEALELTAISCKWDLRKGLLPPTDLRIEPPPNEIPDDISDEGYDE